MRAWKFVKSRKIRAISNSKELLTTLLSNKSQILSAEEASPGTDDTADDRLVEPMMLNFLERKSEKRIFYSYLNRFGLTHEHVGSKVSRLLLDVIHSHAERVAKRFDEPMAAVSRNIISAAAWGTIYCLLGSSRMIEMRPDYRDIADEVELELMILYSQADADGTIYHDIFSILDEYGLCHPEVKALLAACMVTTGESQQEAAAMLKAV